MTEFAHYTVELHLKDHQRVGGTVAQVADKRVTLTNAQFLPNGGRFASFTIEGAKIHDLKVTGLPLGGKKKQRQRPANDAVVFLAKKKLAQGVEEWDTDVSEAVGTDFDFTSNLKKFDKHRVFEELRASDTVLPSDRLVGHNKLEDVKYGNTEMVLTAKSDGWESAARDATRVSVSEAATLGLRRLLHGRDEVPVCSPIQLLEIERLCMETYHLTPLLIVENAAINLLSVVIGLLGGASRVASTNHNAPPLVVLLVGNNRAGSRTLACGRHLSNKGFRTVAFVLTAHTGNEDELDDAVRQQLALFKLFGGRVFHALVPMTSFLKGLDSPVELIIDGLQGFDSNVADLWGAELDLCTALIQWANQQGCGKLSLEIPSGIDPGSGQVAVEDLWVDSRWVVSCGLPLNGLLQAYRMDYDTQWIHFLVDIAVPSALYTKGSFRKFNRVWFADTGVTQLTLA